MHQTAFGGQVTARGLHERGFHFNGHHAQGFVDAARGNLTAKGRLMHRSKSMAFTESTLFDEAGNACAHATGTFKYVNKAPDTHHTQQGLHEISTD